ncbi:unnamed protein product [Tilletia controversa]|nr:unnamed protein product [Tilletia controversa]CAD6911305.1 unnamed protein product [Tilletia controversa]CAD6945912.1 unnamed protein product [Tilletia controversa]CAD6972233.1 unnamed protein product [Tilletia controversa]CAD6981461.1 unnamed protein product [Tilletia controversa]
MRAFSTLLSLVALASSLSLATASIGSDRHANGGLEIRKHHHHTTTKHHHRLPSEPTGRKHHKGHHKPDADNEDKPKTKKKHHSTTTTKKHHHHTTTPAQAKPTSSHKTKTTAKAATTTAKSTTHATSHPQATHKYGLLCSDKVRGVSDGNWLVVENWMDKRLDTALNAIAVHAPASVVKKTKGKPIVDEYTMGLYADKEQASALVMEHFEKWMTEKDWKRIAQYGLNSVRIPFPHYAFADCIEKGAPYLPLNRVEKLKEGVLLAKKYGIKVWISLHTLPGSQNGYDSSGRIGPPGWATKADYATLSTRAFNHLVSIFSEEPYASAILAIEPANEPTAAQSPEILATLKKYYPLAYDMIHKANTVSRIQPASPIRFAAHDGWKGMRYWSEPVAFFDESARQQMFLGMHPYYIFGDDVKNMTDSQRIAKACTFGEKIATYSSVYTIVASECGINAPRGDSGWGRDMHQADHLQFEDPELDYPFSDEYMRFLALNFRAQQQAYERGAGWMIWSWKHFQHRDWSYKSGVRYGWLPRTPAELDHQPFGKLCP